MAINRPYTAQTWATGDVITKDKLKNIEDAIAAIDSEVTGARGYGASSGTLGKRIDDLVMIQDTQPTSANNEIWVRSTGSGVQVPTYEEFEDLVENTVHVNEAQLFIDTQKVQARNNISAASQADVDDLKSALIVMSKYDSSIADWDVGYTVTSGGVYQYNISTSATELIDVTGGDIIINQSNAKGMNDKDTVVMIAEYKAGAFQTNGRTSINDKGASLTLKNDTDQIRIIFGYAYATGNTATKADIDANFAIQFITPSATRKKVDSIGTRLVTAESAIDNVKPLNEKQTVTITWTSNDSIKKSSLKLIKGRVYKYTNNTDGATNLYCYYADNTHDVIFSTVSSGQAKYYTCDKDNYVAVGGYASNAGTATFESIDVGAFDAIHRVEEKTNVIPLTTVSMFETLGAIGDSFTSGGLYGVTGATSGNHYQISWPQILARHCGLTATNYSTGGTDVSAWLSNNDIGLPKLESDSPKDLYVIVLGINSEKQISDRTASADVGTTSDIDTSDPTQNADTFCGHYGKMVSGIIAHAPNAKIILVKPVITGTEKRSAIEAIGELFDIPVIDMNQEPFYKTNFYLDNRYTSHPIGATYAGMALAFERQINQCIVDNVEYFTDYEGTTPNVI